LNRACAALIFVVLSLFGCGGQDSAGTIPVAVPTDAPVGIITVPVAISPGPGPGPVSGGPSERCANGNMPVAWVNIELFTVTNAHGQPRPFLPSQLSLMGPFYKGEALRFNASGRDRFGAATNGCTDEGPRWHVSPPELVEWNSPRGWMPSARVVGGGIVTVTAEFEGGTLDYPLRLLLVGITGSQ